MVSGAVIRPYSSVNFHCRALGCYFTVVTYQVQTAVWDRLFKSNFRNSGLSYVAGTIMGTFCTTAFTFAVCSLFLLAISD